MRGKHSRNLTLSALLTLALPLAAYAESPQITVYNQNFALVKDYRTLNLKPGLGEVEIDDVAARIEPTSVHLEAAKGGADALSLLEQNFRYDIISKTAVLDRMVGKTIRFRKDGTLRSGTLLNPATQTLPGGGGTQIVSDFAVKTNEGVLLTSLSDIEIDQLPAGLYPKPALQWRLRSKVGGPTPVQLSYLTQGLNWSADYVAVIGANDDKLDLTGWVTLDNQSGASFPDATLKLVAGDVRRVQEPRMMESFGAMDRAMPAPAAKAFQEESFFEYHLYTLQDKTTLANNETKQIELMSGNNIPAVKQFVFAPNGGRIYYKTGRRSQPDKVSVMLSVKNSEANHLGMALPKGKMRIYKADSTGALQFIGEDMIDHTPTDETIRVEVGNAFDVVGEKRQTNYQQTNTWQTTSYEVKLRNHKAAPITVQVLEESLWGDWRIPTSSLKFVKEDANTVRFDVPVPAKGEATVTYTVETKR